MAQTGRLHHDIEVAERAAMGLVAGIIVTGFVLLAAAATVYDIGGWVDAW